MDQATHNRIVSFIWGIADDVLRDLFRRGKYPDVILPMCVIRRMDAVLEPTKPKVLATKKMLDGAHITEQSAALCDAAGHAFYNTSRFTLRDLAVEKRLGDWGDDEDGGEHEEGSGTKEGLPETKIKKLLDPEAWERGGRLIEVATKLREALGEGLLDGLLKVGAKA